MRELDFPGGNKIELVCTFDPEPTGDNHGYISVFGLLFRADHEKLAERFGLEQSIDLGFKLGNKTFMPDGKIIDDLGDHVILWPESI